MPVAPEKTLGPTQYLPYLGLALDFLHQLLAIPEEKREKCSALVKELLVTYENQKKTMVKKIQKVAGSLNFICQPLPVGTPFLHSLYSLTKTANSKKRRAGHYRKINKETYQDLQMFQGFLDENTHLSVKTVPFLSHLAIDNNQIHLFANAASAADKGFGCTFGNHWAYGIWSQTTLFQADFKPNIALLELYAITLALEIWADQIARITITLCSYNIAKVCILNRKKAKIPAAKSLLCHLTKTCLNFQIIVKADHIPGVSNVNADLLSRGCLQEFQSLNPQADSELTSLPALLWPPVWIQLEMTTEKLTQSRKKENQNKTRLFIRRRPNWNGDRNSVPTKLPRPDSAESPRTKLWESKVQNNATNIECNGCHRSHRTCC